MKLSITNLAWTPEYDCKMYENLQKYGFCGLEIAPTRLFSSPYEQPEKVSAFRKHLLQQYNLEIPSMQSIWYGRQEKLFSDEKQRNFLLKYTKQAIIFAEAANCHNIVLGSPKNRCLFYDTDYQTGILFFLELAQFAKDHHTNIGIEANPAIYHTNYINTTQQAIQLIHKVNHKNFRLNLDIGTMIANNESADVICGSVHLIQHVHFSEPYLKCITPRSLHSEIMHILKEEKYTGYISIEMGLQPDLQTVIDVMQYIKRVVYNEIS